MANDKESIKAKIILATIMCIEKKGIDSITVRDITKEAQVNVAAINYYFGSKDNLIEIALKQTLNEGFPEMIKETIDLYPEDKYQGLLKLFQTQLQGMQEWPGVTKAHFFAPLLKNDYEGLLVKQLNDFLEDILNKVRSYLPKDEKTAKISLVQMISAILLPGLLPNLFSDFADIDFNKPEEQKEYAQRLVSLFLDNKTKSQT